MNDFPWFVKYKNILRGMILVLLVISLAGPWMFDQVNVPAEYDCDKPFMRLEGDFCSVPVSGFQFFGLLSILPLIPFFTSLFLIWKKDPRRLQTINLVAWILALISTLMVFILQIKDQVIQLWGLWLYIIAALSAVVFEVRIKVWERKSGN